MSEPPADYARAVHARHRAAVLDRIADRIADGVMADLPDVFLIIINRALDRDLTGVREFARNPNARALPIPSETTP